MSRCEQGAATRPHAYRDTNPLMARVARHVIGEVLLDPGAVHTGEQPR
ncbi:MULTISPECIES: hypothetical protein [unclassified Streptomyces]